MNTALWIVAWLLAAAFLGSGLMKVLRPKEELRKAGMTWVDFFSPTMVKVIGGLEILAAIGLVLPALLDIAPILVPLAAAGLVLTMIGAAITHARMKDYKGMVPSLVLLLLSAFVAWGRFGPHSF
jgi:uncharacterized membrane protein YphA (DoxX/SURF4 family)